MNSEASIFALMAPEVFVLTMACTILVVDVFLPDRMRAVSYYLSLATLAAAAVLSFAQLSGGMSSMRIFDGMFISDSLGMLAKLTIEIIVFIAFFYSRAYLADRKLFRGEYYVLGLFGMLGMMVMVSAGNLLTIYLGLELLSLSLYALVAFNRDSASSSEAAMKYFVLGAIASGLLLYGLSMIYGATGTLDIATVKGAIKADGAKSMILAFGLVFIVVAIAFKIGAVPFHMWVPDVYHGAPTPVTLYLSSAPKIAAFVMIMRLLVGGLEGLAEHWQMMLMLLAVASIALGNIVAISQRNIKRMLAYSAISHMGFFLLGILSATENGYSAALFYVMIYAIMSVGAFGVIVLLSREGFEADQLDDLKGLNYRHPWYAFLMLLFMFSMAGVPPTIGFYAKLMVIQSVVEVNMLWLAVTVVLLAVIGAFYYLRIIKIMYFDKPDGEISIGHSIGFRAMLSINALSLILALPFVGMLISLCRDVIRTVAQV